MATCVRGYAHQRRALVCNKISAIDDRAFEKLDAPHTMCVPGDSSLRRVVYRNLHAA